MEDQRRTIQEKKQKLKYALDGVDDMVVIISYFIVLNQSSVSIKEKSVSSEKRSYPPKHSPKIILLLLVCNVLLPKENLFPIFLCLFVNLEIYPWIWFCKHKAIIAAVSPPKLMTVIHPLFAM